MPIGGQKWLPVAVALCAAAIARLCDGQQVYWNPVHRYHFSTSTWSQIAPPGYACEYDGHTRHATTNTNTCKNHCDAAGPACNAIAVGSDCVNYYNCRLMRIAGSESWGFTYHVKGAGVDDGHASTKNHGCISGSAASYAACNIINDEATCLASRESRSGVNAGFELYGQPCAWCCGAACLTTNNNRCEPVIWLESTSGGLARGANGQHQTGRGHNSCPGTRVLPLTPVMSCL